MTEKEIPENVPKLEPYRFTDKDKLPLSFHSHPPSHGEQLLDGFINLTHMILTGLMIGLGMGLARKFIKY